MLKTKRKSSRRNIKSCKTEKSIENEILNYLTANGVYCWKHENNAVYDPKRKQFRLAYSRFKFKGISDIIGILNDGRLLAIEVKRPDKLSTVTTEQQLFIEQICDRGGVAFVATCVDDVRVRLFRTE